MTVIPWAREAMSAPSAASVSSCDSAPLTCKQIIRRLFKNDLFVDSPHPIRFFSKAVDFIEEFSFSIARDFARRFFNADASCPSIDDVLSDSFMPPRSTLDPHVMSTPTRTIPSTIGWLDLRTYLDRQAELLWRMENRIPSNVFPLGPRDRRLSLFLAESVAAHQVAKDMDLIEAVTRRLRIGIRTGTGPLNSWCFLFTPPGTPTPLFFPDLGDAYGWLREQQLFNASWR